ncbi:MAG: MlaC/ttg2D family ABC transporter substrate-binding protein [Burkholderiales bacterium]
MLAAEIRPDTLIKQVSQDVLDIVKKDKDIQKGNRQKIIDLAEAKVLPYFDFNRMTMLAVGRNWRTATPEQRKQLTTEFRTLLVNTYSNALGNYKNQTIDYKPLAMNGGDTDVVVKTLVNQPGGQPIPIDYSMEKTAAGWMAYDIKVDGVSLVINYRSSFESEIRTSGIDGLIKSIAERNRKNVASNGHVSR